MNSMLMPKRCTWEISASLFIDSPVSTRVTFFTPSYVVKAGRLPPPGEVMASHAIVLEYRLYFLEPFFRGAVSYPLDYLFFFFPRGELSHASPERALQDRVSASSVKLVDSVPQDVKAGLLKKEAP
ncbi:MAG: hypothetical protein P8Y66_00120 [Nitrospirota bacterium]